MYLIIASNVVVGEVDQSPLAPDAKHTDDGGIILDYDTDSAPPTISCPNPPAALIANNVVYGNVGQRIIANQVSNFWVVNNTCYKNELDLSEGPYVGGFVSFDSKSGTFVNNISVVWQPANPA